MRKLVFGATLLALLGGCVSAPGWLHQEVGQSPRPVSEPAAATSPPTGPGAVCQEPDVAEETLDTALDAETREDNALLAAAEASTPEDEGVSVPAAEEVTFDFPVVENAKVRHFIDFYRGRGRKTFNRWLARSGRYLPLMRKIFAEEGLPLDLTYLAMIESGFNERAYSWAHAVGPWQFIEGTGKMMGLQIDWWHDERRDFAKSTRAAARFLKDLHQRFDGNWYLAVAGYNAGPGKIARAIRKYHSEDFWEISRGHYLQPETRNYVPKLLAAILLAKEPQKYGLDAVAYHEPLAFETVSVPTATDLEIVAGLCDVDYQTIKQLNPELKRWCTPPGEKNYRLRIPVGTRERFAAGYQQIPATQRANYKHHQVRQGDTLLALANKYGIRVKDIVRLNNIQNPRILSIGTDLILPLHKSFSRLPVAELEDDFVRTRRRTYTVRSGDSLWTIAHRFDVSERNLRVWNRLGWSNVIRPGQVLAVSARGSHHAGSSRPARATNYKVRPGDSLWTIARRFDVSAQQLRSWNRLGGNIIRPGQVLAVAARAAAGGHDVAAAVRTISYKVRRGDTLWGIGRQFDVPTSQIQDWNDLGDDHILRPGDVLTLMVQGDHRRS